MQLKKAHKVEAVHKPTVHLFFLSKLWLYWHFYQRNIKHVHSTSFICTKSDCIFRRWPVAYDIIFNMTKRWVCQHQVTYFIVHMEGTYCACILSNKPIHNGELAFEMPFVCLWAYNMRQGSKSRCFVILQINTKQFPLEFINISDVIPQSADARGRICLAGASVCPAGWEISIKQ